MNQTAPQSPFRFSLRALFITPTLAAIPLGWVGWQMRWIRQRRDTLEWLNEHKLNATMLNRLTPRPDLPWSLRVFGEKPLALVVIAANASDKTNLEAYLERVAYAEQLFPECYLINMDAREAAKQ